jgi:hypothetical protein
MISSKNDKLIACAKELESSKTKGYVNTILDVVKKLIFIKETVELGEFTKKMMEMFEKMLR